jgi:fatty acid-binding protein DegV
MSKVAVVTDSTATIPQEIMDLGSISNPASFTNAW